MRVLWAKPTYPARKIKFQHSPFYACMFYMGWILTIWCVFSGPNQLILPAKSNSSIHLFTLACFIWDEYLLFDACSLGQTNLSCPQNQIPAFTFLRLHVLYGMNTYYLMRVLWAKPTYPARKIKFQHSPFYACMFYMGWILTIWCVFSGPNQLILPAKSNSSIHLFTLACFIWDEYLLFDACSLGQTNLSCPQSQIPAFTFLRLHVLYWMHTYLYVIEYIRRTKSEISEFTIALKTDFHGGAIMMEKENQ